MTLHVVAFLPDPNISAIILPMTDDPQYATIRLEVCDPAELAAADGSLLAIRWKYDEWEYDEYGDQAFEIAAEDRRMLDWHRVASDELVLVEGCEQYQLDEIINLGDDICYYWNRIKPLLLPAD